MITKTKEEIKEMMVDRFSHYIDVTGPLGIRNAVGNVHNMLEAGTGADRQLKVFEETNSLPAVVDYIHSQFLAGL